MNLFQLYGTIGLKSDDFNKGINDATGKAEGFASKIGSIVKTVGGIKIVSAAFDMVKHSIGGAVERYDILNRFPKLLQSMGYSADEASAATDKLRDGVVGLPTPLQDVVSTAQGLTVLTGNLDSAVDTTLALNNAFLASGSSTADASRGLVQYQQMLSKGKVDMQSWRTLQETMGYALRQTAESFGFAGQAATTEFYEALKSGKITYEQFNARLIELSNTTGGFAEMAKTASGGIGTSWANMQTAIVRGTASIISSIDNNLTKNSLPNLQGMIEITGKSFEGLLNHSGKLAGGLVSGAAKAAKFTADNMHVLAPAVIAATTAFGVVKGIQAFTAATKAAELAVNGYKATASLSKMIQEGAIATDILAAAAKGKLAGAEALRTAMKQAGLKVDQEGNVTTAAGIVLSEAEAAAVVASSGAITAKTVLVGLLSGSMTIAEAATWAWGIALKALPFVGIVAGVAAVAGGIAAIIHAAGESERATQRLNERMSNLRNEMDKTSQMESQIKKYKQLDKELKDTSLSSEKAAEKQEELNTVRRWIIDNSNGVVTAEDDITGAFGRQLEILEDVTSQAIAQNDAVLKSLATDAQENFAATLEKVNTATEKENRLSAEQEKLANNQGAAYDKLKKIRAAYAAGEDEAAAATGRANDTLKEAEKLTGLQFKSTDDLQKRIDELSASYLDSVAAGNENISFYEQMIELERLRDESVAGNAAAIDARTRAEERAQALSVEAIAIAGDQIRQYLGINELVDINGNLLVSTGDVMEAMESITKSYGVSVGELTEEITENGEASTEARQALIDTIAILRQAAAAGYITAEEFEAFKNQALEAGVSLEELGEAAKDLADTEKKSAVIGGASVVRRQRAYTDYHEKYKKINDEQTKITKKRAEQEKWLTIQQTAEANKRGMTLEEYSNLLEDYARRFDMTVDEVTSGIALMGGDMEGWAATTEQSLRAAQAAEQDYIDQIKVGNVEITNSRAEMLEARRLNGEELTAIEQAELDQWNSMNLEREKAVQAMTNTVMDMFNRISEKSGTSMKKVTGNLNSNVAVAERWAENITKMGERYDQDFIEVIKAKGLEGAGVTKMFAEASDKDAKAFMDAWRNADEYTKGEMLVSMGLTGTAASEAMGTGYEEGDIEAKMTAANKAAGDAAGLVAVKATKEGILNNISELDEATTAIVTAVSTGLTEKTEDFTAYGATIVDDLATGVSGSTALDDAVTNSISNARATADAQISASVFTATGEAIGADTAGGITSSQPTIDTSAQELIKGARTAADSQVTISDFKVPGAAMVADFIIGIGTMLLMAQTAVQDLIKKSRSSADSQVTASDFKVPGATAGQNIAEGLDSKQTKAKTAAQDIVKAAKTAATTQVTDSKFNAVGESIVQKMIDGLDSKSSSLYTKIKAIITAALNTASDATGTTTSSKGPGTANTAYSNGLSSLIESASTAITKAMDAMSVTESDPLSATPTNRSAWYSPQQYAFQGAGVTVNQYINAVPQTPAEFGAVTKQYFERARWVK